MAIASGRLDLEWRQRSRNWWWDVADHGGAVLLRGPDVAATAAVVVVQDATVAHVVEQLRCGRFTFGAMEGRHDPMSGRGVFGH